MVELVHHRHTLYFHEGAGFHTVCYFSHLFVMRKKLNGHCIGKIRHIINQDRSLILDFPLIHADNLTADNHFPYFPDDFADRHCLLVKIPAVQYVGIVGTLDGAFEIRLFIVAVL